MKNVRGLITLDFDAEIIIPSSAGIWSTGFRLNSDIVPKYLLKALCKRSQRINYYYS